MNRHPSLIADAHVHLFAPASDRYPREIAPLFPEGAQARPDAFREVMEHHGVNKAVVVALSAHDRYLPECLAEHSDAFAGIGVLEGSDLDPDGSVVEQSSAIGLRGLRLFRLGATGVEDVAQLPSFPTLAAMARGGLKLWLYCPPDQLPLVSGVAAALPELDIVLNHLGFFPTRMSLGRDGLHHADVTLPPATLPAVLELSRYRNVYVMVSGEYGFSYGRYPFEDVRPVVRALYQSFGADRMMWGSDYPWAPSHLGYERLMALPRLHLPEADEEELDLIMGGTVSRLFWS
jgi:L-fuconolactonase